MIWKEIVVLSYPWLNRTSAEGLIQSFFLTTLEPRSVESDEQPTVVIVTKSHIVTLREWHVMIRVPVAWWSPKSTHGVPPRALRLKSFSVESNLSSYHIHEPPYRFCFRLHIPASRWCAGSSNFSVLSSATPMCKSISLTSTPQEARKEGVFAGLSSGLASGEHYFVIDIGWNRNRLFSCQLS